MQDYTYFVSGITAEDLEAIRQMILEESLLADTYSSIETVGGIVDDVEGYFITIYFTEALSSENESLLENLVEGYPTSVPVAKKKKLALLTQMIQDYLDSHYELRARIQLMNLYNMSRWTNKTNRAAYILPFQEWVESILTYAASTANAIKVLDTFSAIQSYEIDIDGNVSSDPHVKVGAAVLIVD